MCDNIGSTCRTPNKYKKYGRRRWDGAVRTWKQQIHSTITGLEEVREHGQDLQDKGIIFDRHMMRLHTARRKIGSWRTDLAVVGLKKWKKS